MCRAGAPWRGLPERCGKWVTVWRRFDRWSGDGAMEHLLMDRAHEGDPTRAPAESFGLAPVVPPRRNRTAPWDCDGEAHRGAEHGRTCLQPHEALPQGRTRYDRLDETFLANPRLILIAIYLRKHSQNPANVNTP